MSRKSELLCLWCGPVFLALLGVGLVLAGLWPPPSPTAGSEQISAFYLDHLTRTRVGLCLMMAGIGLEIPWGVAIAVQTHRIKAGSPVLPFVQVAAVAVSTIIGVLSIVLWGAASFRPDEISPEATRTLNDLGWLFFAFDWSPLFVWFMAVALAIFGDRDEAPIFPRWAAYLSVWVAMLSAPGGLVILFKTGPVAFNGVLGIWVPLCVFFVWIVALTVLAIKAVNRGEVELDSREPSYGSL
jgi:hypothetical protein